jgi:hypothetical protein
MHVTFCTQSSWSRPVLSNVCNISYSMFLEPTSTDQCVLYFLLNVPGANQYWPMCVTFFTKCSWSQPILTNVCFISYSMFLELTRTNQCIQRFLLKVPGANKYWAMCVTPLTQGSWSQPVLCFACNIHCSMFMESTSTEHCMQHFLLDVPGVNKYWA